MKKILQIYLLWRMVRESRLRSKKRWKRRYFQLSEIILQLSDAERIIIEEKYDGKWIIPAMDLGFFARECKERADLWTGVYEYPIERYDNKYNKSLMYFEHMRQINQYHRKVFRLLLKKII